jgi:periplasmic divalent cation tolerance protein
MIRNKTVSTGAIIIISTFANENSLRNFAHEMIVEQKLCACVNYTKVRSLYWWENKLNDEEEFIALFKTTNKKARELRNRIEKQHSYDIPEILEISVDKASKPYLNWLIGSTSIVVGPKRRQRKIQRV